MMPLRRVCVLLALVSCATVQAHRLDEYLQSTTVRVTAGRVFLHLRMVPGVAVATQLWQSVDSNGDGDLAASEQQAYAERVVNDLSVQVDDRDLPLEIVHLSFPSHADAVRGMAQISLSLEAATTGLTGAHHLRFVSRHRPVPSVYLVNALLPVDDTIRISGQRHSADQSAYDLDFSVR